MDVAERLVNRCDMDEFIIVHCWYKYVNRTLPDWHRDTPEICSANSSQVEIISVSASESMFTVSNLSRSVFHVFMSLIVGIEGSAPEEVNCCSQSQQQSVKHRNKRVPFCSSCFVCCLFPRLVLSCVMAPFVVVVVVAAAVATTIDTLKEGWIPSAGIYGNLAALPFDWDIQSIGWLMNFIYAWPLLPSMNYQRLIPFPHDRHSNGNAMSEMDNETRQGNRQIKQPQSYEIWM